MDRAGFQTWIDRYERAWRSAGTASLRELFAADVRYSCEPYGEPITGLESLAQWWDDNRDGPDEVFTLRSAIVAVEGDTGVARVEVAYGDPIIQEYRDLWVVRTDADGRCVAFEEWPFWPGHGRSPSSSRPTREPDA